MKKLIAALTIIGALLAIAGPVLADNLNVPNVPNCDQVKKSQWGDCIWDRAQENAQ